MGFKDTTQSALYKWEVQIITALWKIGYFLVKNDKNKKNTDVNNICPCKG